MSEKRSDILTLKKVRLSFPKIFEKTRTNEEGPEKYTLSALMDPGTPEGKANIEAVKAMQTRLAKATWKDKWEKVLKATEWERRLLRPGAKATNAEGDEFAGYEGVEFSYARKH